jgi:hypothetical protein
MDYGSGASTLNGIFEWRDTVVKAFMFSTEEFNLYPAGGSKRKWLLSSLDGGIPPPLRGDYCIEE